MTKSDAKLLHVDASTWKSGVIQGVKHGLVGHPSLQMDALLALAKRLPASQVRINSGHVPINTDLHTIGVKHSTGRGIDETFAHIESAGSFVFLQSVQTDPEYRRLVDSVLDEVQEMVEAQEGPMSYREGWIFVSSPGIITPYHRDQETNFLLHCQGKKTVSVFPVDDLAVVSHEESEIFHGEHHLRATIHTEEKQKRAEVFELEPGMGAYMPYSAPHWVKNGDQVSITFSATYHTAASKRRKNVYKMNYKLRQQGKSPVGFGVKPWLDSMKNQAVLAGLAMDGIKGRLRGKRPVADPRYS
ncbi:MAG TPA: transcriptional regulator [Bdellovibrionota bacterium]|jgi:hypothetical protein|nr:transcriptional regulator [Bdellovibrionota bacterium]